MPVAVHPGDGTRSCGAPARNARTDRRPPSDPAVAWAARLRHRAAPENASIRRTRHRSPAIPAINALVVAMAET